MESRGLDPATYWSPYSRHGLLHELFDGVSTETAEQGQINVLEPIQQRAFIENLGSRSYWSRVWVIQEILLAREAYFYCGQNYVSWTALYNAMCYAKGQHNGHSSAKEDGNGVLLVKARLPQEGGRDNLLSLMEAFPLSDCSIHHDKLYGLLGVASDVPRGSIPVNYNASIPEVELHVLKWFLDGNCQVPGVRPEFLMNYLAMTFGDGPLCSRDMFYVKMFSPLEIDI